MNIKEYSLHNLKLLQNLVSPEFDKETLLNSIQIHQSHSFDENDPHKDSVILYNIQDIVNGYMLRHEDDDISHLYSFLSNLISEIEKLY